jgi:hypothetical protein
MTWVEKTTLVNMALTNIGHVVRLVGHSATATRDGDQILVLIWHKGSAECGVPDEAMSFDSDCAEMGVGPLQ